MNVARLSEIENVMKTGIKNKHISGCNCLVFKDNNEIAYFENGYRDIATFEKLQAGDKVYFINREKSMYLAIIGEESIERGLHIIGSHVDSPRLDLKPNPLYEDTELAYLKTHYYGGIKKYQWTTIPLSIHGVIVKPNGEKITVNIGEDENDPIFTITDLLPHLAQEQMEKKLKNGINGEDLNVLIGSIPYNDDKAKEKVKLNILNILNQKYGIIEADLQSSELEIIPAFKARSLGFDSSMVAAYGQDDKVCAYTSLAAMMSLESVKNTAICILSDKEEIGSMGNTGMESHMFDFFISEMLNKLEVNKPNMLDKAFCFLKTSISLEPSCFPLSYSAVLIASTSTFSSSAILLFFSEIVVSLTFNCSVKSSTFAFKDVTSFPASAIIFSMASVSNPKSSKNFLFIFFPFPATTFTCLSARCSLVFLTTYK